MRPVALETVSEQKCLSDYVTSSTTDANGAQSLPKSEFLSIILTELISESWKFNYNYWTRGFYLGAASGWSWLDLQTQSSAPVVNESGWLKGHPKTESGFECVNLKVFTNISGEKIKLGARNCSHKFIYMCEVN